MYIYIYIYIYIAATHALRHMTYGCMSCHKAIVVITR